MFNKLKVPIVIILIFVSFILIWDLLNLPPDEVLLSMAQSYFLKYGFITIILASIIEGALVIGWYLPGGVVIFTGVILASGDPKRAILSVLATIIGLSLAYILNYFIGRYGWYRAFVVFGLKNSLENSKVQFQKYGYKAIFMSYWQPNLAALVSTSAGILHIPFKRFFIYSTFAAITWSVFWGTMAYVFGQKILKYLGIVFFGVMIVWIIYIILNHYFEKKLSNKENINMI